jgi:hypothetical protein
MGAVWSTLSVAVPIAACEAISGRYSELCSRLHDRCSRRVQAGTLSPKYRLHQAAW